MGTPVAQRRPARQGATCANEIDGRSWGVDTCLGTTCHGLVRGRLFPDGCLHPLSACWFRLRLLLSAALVVSG